MVTGEDVDTFYTYGGTEFERVAIDILKHMQAEGYELKIVKLVKKNEPFSLTEDMPYDDIYKMKSNYCINRSHHITRLSDYLIINDLENSYTKDLIEQIIMDYLLYQEMPILLLMYEILFKKNTVTDL